MDRKFLQKAARFIVEPEVRLGIYFCGEGWVTDCEISSNGIPFVQTFKRSFRRNLDGDRSRRVYGTCTCNFCLLIRRCIATTDSGTGIESPMTAGVMMPSLLLQLPTLTLLSSLAFALRPWGRIDALCDAMPVSCSWQK